MPRRTRIESSATSVMCRRSRARCPAVSGSSGSRNALQVDTGSLYPALHRLERQGAIDAEWGVSENNQRVRIYQLTAAGRRQLTAERSKWKQLADAIAGVMAPPAESDA